LKTWHFLFFWSLCSPEVRLPATKKRVIMQNPSCLEGFCESPSCGGRSLPFEGDVHSLLVNSSWSVWSTHSPMLVHSFVISIPFWATARNFASYRPKWCFSFVCCFLFF
jgi:hypothetical protein